VTAYQRTLIKQQKYFHRNYYRRLSLATVISMIISIGLLVAIFYVHISKPPISFYATNAVGTGHPIPLQALDTPNMSSNYLLPPDPVEEITIKKLRAE
jgi:intracellular multiplication protein IcmM